MKQFRLPQTHITAPPVHMSSGGAHMSSGGAHMSSGGAHMWSGNAHMSSGGAHMSSGSCIMSSDSRRLLIRHKIGRASCRENRAMHDIDMLAKRKVEIKVAHIRKKQK